jgi:hypothetical protein
MLGCLSMAVGYITVLSEGRRHKLWIHLEKGDDAGAWNGIEAGEET